MIWQSPTTVEKKLMIFASVQNCTSSKFKTIRPSVELDDCVKILNNIYNLIEQKGPAFVGGNIEKYAQ